MGAYKAETRTQSVVDAVADAFSEFDTLAQEMREAADNMEGGNLGHTEKCQAYGEAADELENHNGQPDIDDDLLSGLSVSYSVSVNRRRARAPSRAVRCDNAKAAVQAVIDVLEERIQALESLRDELQEHADFDVEFPGMYG